MAGPESTTTRSQDPEAPRARSAEEVRALEDAIAGTILGQTGSIREVVSCLLAGGHALLEGAPGMGKTLLVRSLAAASGLTFTRIQFTPDLLPADITGSEILDASRAFEFRPGPLFGNVVLADEVNRATPRTQSALMEAMAERGVSVGNHRHALPDPFCVLATQNPVEMEGTFPLPEAQLDRFLLKILVPPPDESALVEILQRTDRAEPSLPGAVLPVEDLRRLIAEVRTVVVPEPLLRLVARWIRATSPFGPEATDAARRTLRLGASPRGGEALCRVARVAALREGRGYVNAADLAWALFPALRHRLLPSFEAEARGLVGDALVRDVLHDVPELPKEVEHVLAALDR